MVVAKAWGEKGMRNWCRVSFWGRWTSSRDGWWLWLYRLTVLKSTELYSWKSTESTLTCLGATQRWQRWRGYDIIVEDWIDRIWLLSLKKRLLIFRYLLCGIYVPSLILVVLLWISFRCASGFVAGCTGIMLKAGKGKIMGFVFPVTLLLTWELWKLFWLWKYTRMMSLGYSKGIKILSLQLNGNLSVIEIV